MANTYTDTITETLYKAMEKLQNEPVALLQSVQRNVSEVTNASFGKSVESLVTGDVTITNATSYAPQMDDVDAPAVTDGKDSFALTNHIHFDIPILPEQQRHADNTIGWTEQLQQRLMKGIRGGRNTMEADIAAAMYKGASKSTGASGTTPFASNTDIIEDGMKLLVDQGVNRYQGDISMAINTSAGANFRKLLQLQKVDEAGTADLLRRGILLSLNGTDIRESGQIQSHTKGTGAGYLVDLGAGYAAGATTIHVDTGTNAILAGDVVTFGADPTEYVVKTGFAGDGDGDIVIAKPGLKTAIVDDASVAIKDGYAANLLYTSTAAEFASRAPLLGQDKAIFRDVIQDPLTGFMWSYSIYPGIGMQRLRVETFAGYKVWNPFELVSIRG